MDTPIDTDLSGHRNQLRLKYSMDKNALTETELLELLLTYAIPRVDVRPIAEALLAKYQSIPAILGAETEELLEINGLGKSAALFINLVGHIKSTNQSNSFSTGYQIKNTMEQPKLIDIEPELGPLFERKNKTDKPELRIFANDEIVNSLKFIPMADQYDTIEHFRNYLIDSLPYNSKNTRIRRSKYIIDRFFKGKSIHNPLTFFASKCATKEAINPVIFYEILKAEPVMTKVAEELVWPSLPQGKITREQLQDLIYKYFPNISDSSLINMLRSIIYSYSILSIAQANNEDLILRLHEGFLESFLYILTSEFPKPGMYELSKLENGPVRKWLLWDWQWIKEQLYSLRELNIIATISDIEYVQQFNLPYGQMEALNKFFNHPQSNSTEIREV